MLKILPSVRSGEAIVRTRPSGVCSQTVSDGLITFLRSSTPGVQIFAHSSRGPNIASFATGPLRPCWIRPMNIHVHFAFTTRASAFSSYGLKWRCTESVCTYTRSSFDQS